MPVAGSTPFAGSITNTMLADSASGRVLGRVDAGTGDREDLTAGQVRTWLDLSYNVKDYGATGDGVTNDRTAIQSAIDAAEAAGGGTVFFPPGTYVISDVLTVDSSYVKLVGQDATIDGSAIAAAVSLDTQFAIKAFGLAGSAVAVTVNVAVGDSAITVASTTGLAIGDVVLLKSTQNYVDGASGTVGKRGVLHRIKSVDSATQITLQERSFFAYASASTATITKITTLNGFVVDGINITMGGVGSVHNGIRISEAADPIVRNCEFRGCEDSGIRLNYVFGFLVEHNDIRDCTSPTPVGNTGYGVTPTDACRSGSIHNNRFVNCRHGVAGGGDPVTIFIRVTKNEVSDGIGGVSLECHEETWWWDFEENTITGGTDAAILIRGSACKVRRNIIRGTGSAGIWVKSFDTNTDGIIGADITDNDIENTASNGIRLEGTAACRIKGGRVSGNRIKTSRLNNMMLQLVDDMEIGPNDYNGTYEHAGNDGCNIRIVGSSTSSRCEKISIIGGKFRNSSRTVAIRADFTNGLIIAYPKITTGAYELTSCEDVAHSGLKGSTTYDPPSVAAAASWTTTLTVTGAATGDFVVANHSSITGAWQVSAYVSAANTVTVVGTNHTGGTVNLASGTLSAVVIKQ